MAELSFFVEILLRAVRDVDVIGNLQLENRLRSLCRRVQNGPHLLEANSSFLAQRIEKQALGVAAFLVGVNLELLQCSNIRHTHSGLVAVNACRCETEGDRKLGLSKPGFLAILPNRCP